MNQGVNNPTGPKPNDRKVKIFGERNTGTRAVIRMLRAHAGVSPGFPYPAVPELDALEKRVFASMEGLHQELFTDALDDIRRSRLAGLSAWKHAAPVVDESYAEKKTSVLFLVRDPYSWIASFFRNPYHARAPLPPTLAGFVEQPWLTMQRDNIEPILNSPMALWTEKLRAYRAFAAAAPVPSTVLHFEAFVLAPVAALGGALERFGIPIAGLKEAGETTKSAGASRRERIAFYKAKAWEREVSPEAAELINANVDWDVAASFGYKMRDPAEFAE